MMNINPLPFFEFLEKQDGRQIPLVAKLLYKKEPLTAEDLHVKSNLDFAKYQDIDISSLDGLRIDGNFSITDNDVTESLPNNFYVNNDFFAVASAVERINPKYKIHIGRNCVLQSSGFVIEPDDKYNPSLLHVEGMFDVRSTPFETMITNKRVYETHREAIISLISCVGEGLVIFQRIIRDIEHLESYLSYEWREL